MIYQQIQVSKCHFDRETGFWEPPNMFRIFFWQNFLYETWRPYETNQELFDMFVHIPSGND